jgi:hypothetical protein
MRETKLTGGGSEESPMHVSDQVKITRAGRDESSGDKTDLPVCLALLVLKIKTKNRRTSGTGKQRPKKIATL